MVSDLLKFVVGASIGPLAFIYAPTLAGIIRPFLQ